MNLKINVCKIHLKIDQMNVLFRLLSEHMTCLTPLL